MNYQTNSVPDSLLRHELVRQVVDPFIRSIARIQSRQDLWENLSTLERFQRLTEADQQLIAAIAAAASDSGRLKLGTVRQYVNRTLAVAELMCDERLEVGVLFQPQAAYLAAGAFAGTTAVANAKISGVKAMMRGAKSLGLIAENPITATITKVYREPTPATDTDLESAVQRAVALITGKTYWSEVVAYRRLVELDLKSYGHRSIELHHLGRPDFCPDDRRLRLRVSKSDRGERTVYLAESTCLLIEKYLSVLDAHRERLGKTPIGDDGPLLINQRGEAVSARQISTDVSTLLPAGVRPHDLRARIGTEIARLGTNADVAVALRVRPDSTAPYVAALRTEEIGSVVEPLHAQYDTVILGLIDTHDDHPLPGPGDGADLPAGSPPPSELPPPPTSGELRRPLQRYTGAACRSRHDQVPLGSRRVRPLPAPCRRRTGLEAGAD